MPYVRVYFIKYYCQQELRKQGQNALTKLMYIHYLDLYANKRYKPRYMTKKEQSPNFVKDSGTRVAESLTCSEQKHRDIHCII